MPKKKNSTAVSLASDAREALETFAACEDISDEEALDRVVRDYFELAEVDS